MHFVWLSFTCNVRNFFLQTFKNKLYLHQFAMFSNRAISPSPTSFSYKKSPSSRSIMDALDPLCTVHFHSDKRSALKDLCYPPAISLFRAPGPFTTLARIQSDFFVDEILKNWQSNMRVNLLMQCASATPICTDWQNNGIKLSHYLQLVPKLEVSRLFCSMISSPHQWTPFWYH